MNVDRREACRALATALSKKECGKDRDATIAANYLVELLRAGGILPYESGNFTA
jgi:hypothetical protein